MYRCSGNIKIQRFIYEITVQVIYHHLSLSGRKQNRIAMKYQKQHIGAVAIDQDSRFHRKVSK
jgi:hypothetical protein